MRRPHNADVYSKGLWGSRQIASTHSESTCTSPRARARARRLRARRRLGTRPPVAVDVANLLLIANLVPGNGAGPPNANAYFESGRAAEVLVLLHTPKPIASARAGRRHPDPVAVYNLLLLILSALSQVTAST